jgi:hypothetical protein
MFVLGESDHMTHRGRLPQVQGKERVNWLSNLEMRTNP